MLTDILQEEPPGVLFVDRNSDAGLDYEKFSRLFNELFSYFSFIPACLMTAAFIIIIICSICIGGL